MAQDHQKTVRRFWARAAEKADFFSLPVLECNVCQRRIRHPISISTDKGQAFSDIRVSNLPALGKNHCPYCLSSAELRFTLETLRKFTDILSYYCFVLEISPVAGMKQYLTRYCELEYKTADLFPGKADITLDMAHMDLPNACFDYVIACQVLQHLKDERSAILEIKRILKPGGCLVLSVPIDLDLSRTDEDESVAAPEDRLKRFGGKNNFRRYGLDVARRLKGYGFDVQEIIAKRDMPDAVKKYGLMPDDRNYICIKK